jgi:hypothetical protein
LRPEWCRASHQWYPAFVYDFRSEAATFRRVGKIELETFVEISLGIGVADFKLMAASYLGRWDLVQLRCANFMGCSLEERLALIPWVQRSACGIQIG